MPEVPSPSDQRREGASDDRTVAVVIPIPNDPPWELFDAIPPEIPIIVSDDSDGQLAPPPRDNVYYFDYAAQREYCGEHYAAMPHKSAASRNVGHYIAYKEGFDVIVALDYDCGTRPGWLESHLQCLDKVVEAPALAPVTPNGWVNSIDAPGVYARGYPYELRTPELAQVEETTATGEVKINMGIWDGILDLNGIDKLQAGEPGDPQLTAETNRVALGNIPVCGMNTAFAAELTPAYYFLPDLWVNGWQLSRHDDIWGGYIVKKLMDKRDHLFAYGRPIVEHTRQSKIERVVCMEHYMSLLNMPFYTIVDAAMDRVKAGDYTTMFADFTEEYRKEASRATVPVHYREVFVELGEAMQRWSDCFND